MENSRPSPWMMRCRRLTLARGTRPPVPQSCRRRSTRSLLPRRASLRPARPNRRRPRLRTPARLAIGGRRVRGAGSDDHRLGAHCAAIGEFEFERFAVMVIAVATIEMGDLQRDGDFDAEFERLIEGAPGERSRRCRSESRDSSRFATRPRPGRRRRWNRGRSPTDLPSRVDGRSEPGGPSADDRHVVNQVRIELGRDAETDSGFGIGRASSTVPLGHSISGRSAGGTPRRSTMARPSASLAASSTVTG